METIDELMVKDHEKLFSYLEKFEKEENPEITKKLFEKFKWNLEKHLFLEEKAIFELYEKIEGKEITTIFDLMQEHGEILNMLNELEDEFEKDLFQKFKNFLTKHKEFEDKYFYPKIDHHFSSDHKQEIINKINEMIHI